MYSGSLRILRTPVVASVWMPNFVARKSLSRFSGFNLSHLSWLARNIGILGLKIGGLHLPSQQLFAVAIATSRAANKIVSNCYATWHFAS